MSPRPQVYPFTGGDLKPGQRHERCDPGFTRSQDRPLRGLTAASPGYPSAARPREEAPGVGPHHSICLRHSWCCGAYTHPVATMVTDHKRRCRVHHAAHGSAGQA